VDYQTRSAVSFSLYKITVSLINKTYHFRSVWVIFKKFLWTGQMFKNFANHVGTLVSLMKNEGKNEI
jgi:hypothetical protein